MSKNKGLSKKNVPHGTIFDIFYRNVPCGTLLFAHIDSNRYFYRIFKEIPVLVGYSLTSDILTLHAINYLIDTIYVYPWQGYIENTASCRFFFFFF